MSSVNRNPAREPAEKRIGLRLSVYFVLISLGFVFLCIYSLWTLESLRLEREKANKVKSTVDTVEQQLAKNLWDLNSYNIDLILSSLLRSPGISGAVLESSLGDRYAMGPADLSGQTYQRKIVYRQNMVGILTLYCYTDNNHVVSFLKYRYLLVFNGIAIFLMGLIFYLIVNRSIIRHISYISEEGKAASFDLGAGYEPLELKRRHLNDELSILVRVLNNGRKQAIDLLQAKEEHKQQIEYQANYDLLTGLPNRRHLYTYLGQQIQQYSDDKKQLVVIFIDLDGFKQINDSMGHAVGDHVLRECAQRLQKISKTLHQGFIARLGGDEFICCFYAQGYEDIDPAARSIINSFREKIHHEDIQVKLGCSIGITLYPEHKVDDPVEIIRNADSALYKAKESGKNTWFVFNEEILQKTSYEKAVKNKLANLVFDENLEVHYQPLIDMQRNEIIGFEALVRWHDETLGWIAPDLFIRLAEKSGRVFDIDLWVFEQATHQVQQWRQKYQRNFCLSVNFSPTNFYHANFGQWLQSESLKANDTTWVELELTERLMLQNEAAVINGIRALKDKGISFSLDDFGVGYSSLAHIKTFAPLLSKIKIDRIFVDEMLGENFNSAFVRSIIMLSKSLKLKVLAEGVETGSQAALLQSIGCNLAQGYHFYRPMNASAIESIINSQMSSAHSGSLK